ncbi:DUF6318 family protein [Blastococcus sp. TF02A_35]|uniref:DUF6318 family protein n=1 Tax=Blastococcus sp. TF02A-35 TaxID=2559612 RepID=UPI00107383A8|nr:DUF6318 family protein [Blastococcus sp. TF02A_35]TFV47798.1 hypothetical protein E4P43_14795 [Blastococcus sp. TF02A_35]
MTAAALAALLLSGCSEKQEANDALPTAASSPQTTDSRPQLGPEDLPLPDAARTQDASGAEAFVRYYFDLLNYTATTLDAAPLRQLSENCDDCDRIAENAELSAKAGHRYDGGKITITETAPPLIRDARADMAIRLDQTQLVVRDASGNPLAEGGSDAFIGLPGSVALNWDQELESWRMTYMAFG